MVIIKPTKPISDYLLDMEDDGFSPSISVVETSCRPNGKQTQVLNSSSLISKWVKWDLPDKDYTFHKAFTCFNGKNVKLNEGIDFAVLYYNIPESAVENMKENFPTVYSRLLDTEGLLNSSELYDFLKNPDNAKGNIRGKVAEKISGLILNSHLSEDSLVIYNISMKGPKVSMDDSHWFESAESRWGQIDLTILHSSEDEYKTFLDSLEKDKCLKLILAEQKC